MDETWWRDPKDLDGSQKKVLELGPEGDYLLRGPPGSGKTNLLLLRANYVVLSGLTDLRVIVFNHTLQEFIRQGAANYEFAAGHVLTSRQLFYQTLKAEGVDVEMKGPFDEVRQKLTSEMLELTKGLKDPPIGTLLLDEAQDYTPDEVAVLRRLSKHLFITADSRQRIYGAADLSKQLEGQVKEVITLQHHYRNGRSICEFADAIGQTFSSGYEEMLPTCNYDEIGNPSKVECITGTLDKQVDELSSRVATQLRSFPGAMIGILSPRRNVAALIAEKLKERGLGDQLNTQIGEEGEYQPFVPGRPLWLSTIHSAKGLEFRAVHILAIEDVARFGEAQKRLAYTGVTRAKTSLTIYHEQPLPTYVARAVQKACEKKGHVAPEKAFGKAK